MGCGSSSDNGGGGGAKGGGGAAKGGAKKGGDNGQSLDYQKFKKAFYDLSLKTDEGKKARIEAWKLADPNSNGQCSLAELDGWIKKHLLACNANEGEGLWKRFRPCYIRAHADARDIGENKPLSGKASADDYVQKRTFRVFIAYLIIYAEMYDAFDVVDGGGSGAQDNDRKISPDELKKGIPKLKGFSFQCLQNLDEAKADTIFKEIDADGKGAVLLIEWCRYIEQNEQKAGTETGKLLALGDDETD